MIHAGGHVLLYALAAAASPLALTATFVVIRSARPRTNGIAFLSGFLLGTAIACGLGLVLGQAAVNRLDSHTTVEGVVTLLLGVALMLTGLRSWHASPRPRPRPRPRRREAMRADPRQARQRPAGGGVHDGRDARLRRAEAAGAHVPRHGPVSEAGVRDIADVTLVIVYIAIATALVSVPVGSVIIAGERAAVILERSQSWLTTHAATLRVWLSLGIGAALVVNGLLRLFA